MKISAISLATLCAGTAFAASSPPWSISASLDLRSKSNGEDKRQVVWAGYLDGYYQYDFGWPPKGDTVNARGFDISHDQTRFAVGEMDISLAPNADHPWGFNLQLYAGKNTGLIHLAEPGGDETYKLYRQAYISYQPKGSPYTFDLGKFDTWIGNENIDTRINDNYGRSFNWTFSEPTYETGLRVTGKLSNKLTGGLFVVRGWNEVEDGNGDPSFGLQLNYALSSKTGVILQNHFGTEGSDDANDAGTYGGIGFANPGTSKVHLLDLIVSHQLTGKTKLTFNADYATSDDGPNEGKWNGEVIYLRHTLSDHQGVGIRLDRFEDQDGIRTGSIVQLHSITGTFDQTINEHITLRLEARRDFASQAFFQKHGGSLSQNRTTVLVGAVVKF